MNRNLKAMLILVIIMWIIVITAIVAMNKPIIEPPAKPPEPQQVQIIKVKATAFNIYGHDSNGIDYGPGYVIVSSQSEIPLYGLLDIDIYGPCQAIAKSDKLEKDEVQLWYNSPSDVRLFGEQEAWVRVLEMGDRPHKTE